MSEMMTKFETLVTHLENKTETQSKYHIKSQDNIDKTNTESGIDYERIKSENERVLQQVKVFENQFYDERATSMSPEVDRNSLFISPNEFKMYSGIHSPLTQA